VSQNWIPYVQIGFDLVLCNSILSSSVNCEFLPSNQCVLHLLSLSPKCLSLLDICQLS
jgi:hypothetical protein